MLVKIAANILFLYFSTSRDQSASDDMKKNSGLKYGIYRKLSYISQHTHNQQIVIAY